MKKLLLILLTIGAIACKKSVNTPPASQTKSGAPPSTASTTNDSACATQSLAGTWVLDSTVQWNSGQHGSVVVPTQGVSNLTYTLTTNTYYPVQPGIHYLQAIAQQGNIAPAAGYWGVIENPQYQNTHLLYLITPGNLGVGGYIRTLTAHQLVLSQGAESLLQGAVFYLHK